MWGGGGGGGAVGWKRARWAGWWLAWPTNCRRSACRGDSVAMEPTSHSFPANARIGLADPVLQTALGLARSGFPLRRHQAIERLPEFEELREAGRAIKDHTLAHLDFYLERYEQNVAAVGGQVHLPRNPE